MSAVTINRKLNIVLSVEGPKGTVHVHATPIPLAVFEANFLLIARAFTAIYTNGLGPVGGPRVSKLMMQREAKELDDEAGGAALLAEITRRTNVIAPAESGAWETLPFAEAIKRGFLDPESISRVENAVVFFTCASAMQVPSELAVAMNGLRALWRAQISSYNVTEYQRSLPTSTPDANTGESPTPSETVEASPALSIPS